MGRSGSIIRTRRGGGVGTRRESFSEGERNL